MIDQIPSAPAHHASVAVVVDSNAMWNQWGLTGKSWERLRTLVEQGRISFCVPDVVVQEVARGRRHDANDLVSELDAVGLHRIERLMKLGLPMTRTDLTSQVHSLVENYETELRARLDELRAVIIPVPSVDHQVILDRALQRRRPFDAEGRNGYRDVLIWHSLLDVVERGHDGVVFVTNNTKDFCTGKPPSLLPALVAELAEVSPGVKLVVATTIAHANAGIEEVERALGLEHPAFARPKDEDIKAALDLCVDVEVAGVIPPTSGRWGAELDNGWEFRSIIEDDPVEAVSIDFDLATLVCAPDGENWKEFTATVEGTVTLDGFAFKSDYYGEDRISLDVLDSDWNNHYMHVNEYHDATLTFRLTLDEKGSAIGECWLEHAVETISPDEDQPGER
ncbi:PIN domain-containing protein [Actinokineospora pegani]|uniref:PIN domain-containing protein n=1 Tax=Actinokineospora pegani TaxID=2654637 RepID=UPI0018D3E7BA|nr:PIN domain-containing protein [Actinokineospora pegani]